MVMTIQNLIFTAKVVENRERFEEVFGKNKGLKQVKIFCNFLMRK